MAILDPAQLKLEPNFPLKTTTCQRPTATQNPHRIDCIFLSNKDINEVEGLSSWKIE